MATKRVYFDFQQGSGWEEVSDFIRDDLFITWRAFSTSLGPSQDVADFSLQYNETLYEKIINSQEDILVQITETAVSGVLFTGYIPPTKNRTYNGIIDVLDYTLEALDFTEYLREQAGDVVYAGYKIMDPADKDHSLVHQFAYRAGLSDSFISPDVSILTTVSGVAPSSESEEILSLLSTLLYEHGYLLDWNAEGQLAPLPWIIASGTAPVFNFTEQNIVGEVEKQEDDSREYSGTQVIYYEMGFREDVLVYWDDLPYNDDGTFAGYPIPAGLYYPLETNLIDEITGLPSVVYQQYIDTGITYLTNKAIAQNLDLNYKAFASDFSQIVLTQNHVLETSYDDGIILDPASPTFFNKKAQVRFRNTTGAFKNIYYFNIRADVLYKTSQRLSEIVLISGSNNLFSYNSRFLFEKSQADILTKALTKDLEVGKVYYKFKSEEDVPKGAFVNITTQDITNQNCLIMEKVLDDYNDMYKYTLKAFDTNYAALTKQWIKKFGKTLDTNIERQSTELVTPPGTIATITATFRGAEGIEVKWSEVTNTDLDVYELRVGATWATGVTIFRGKAASYLWQNQVAGTYHLMVLAWDTHGNTSVTETSTDITINAPGAPQNLTQNVVYNNMILGWSPPITGSLPVDRYRVLQGAIYGSATVLAEIKSTSFTIYSAGFTTETFWVVAIDTAGNLGTQASISMTVTQIPQTGTTVAPVVPTITARGFYRTIEVKSDTQVNLVGKYFYHLQVSEDNATWYEPQIDGTDWKQGSPDGFATVVTDIFLHLNVPFSGTVQAPTARTLYYRMRRVVGVTQSAWSSSVSASNNPIGTADLVAGSITADKISVVYLSGISADLGDITAGRLFFDEYNYWYGDTKEWRVGNQTSFLKYTPIPSGIVTIRSTEILLTDSFGQEGIFATTSGVHINMAPDDLFDISINEVRGLTVSGTSSLPDNWGSLIDAGFSSNDIYDVAFGNGIFHAVGQLGSIKRSLDAGQSWSNIIGGFGSSTVYGVAFGNGRFVAVGDGGKIGFGDTLSTVLIQASNPFGGLIRAIAFGNGVFIAVGNGGKIARSLDNGETWGSLITNPFGSSGMEDIIYGNGVFIAVGDGGKLARSLDNGATWSSLISTPFGSSNILGIGFGKDTFIIIGQGGKIARSLDNGITWGSLISNPFSGGLLLGIAFGLGFFIVTGSEGKIAYSSDLGVSWGSLITNPFNPLLGSIHDVTYGNGVFIAGGVFGQLARIVSEVGQIDTWISRLDVDSLSIQGNPFSSDEIHNLTLSNGTDANNDLNLSSGWCWDSTRTYFIRSPNTISGKQMDVAYARGNNAGGWDLIITPRTTVTRSKLLGFATLELNDVSGLSAGMTVRISGVGGVGYNVENAKLLSVITATKKIEYLITNAGTETNVADTGGTVETSKGGISVIYPHLIFFDDGFVDLLGSLSPDNPKFQTGMIAFRRLAALPCSSGNILGMIQEKDYFKLKGPFVDFFDAVSTTANRTMRVTILPPLMLCVVNVGIYATAGNVSFVLSAYDEDDRVAAYPGRSLEGSSALSGNAEFLKKTDAFRRLGFRANSTNGRETNVSIGWHDPRRE